MLLTLDNLAQRYGMLPTEALARASTLDLRVLDLSAKWVKHQQDVANGVVKPGAQPSQEQLLAMVSAVKADPNILKKGRTK